MDEGGLWELMDSGDHSAMLVCAGPEGFEILIIQVMKLPWPRF